MHSLNATIAVAIFVVAYGIIMSEKLNRAVVSLAGAVVIIAFGILTQAEAIAGIDFNTLGLLLGMMIIVIITRRSGVFEYVAIKAAKLAKGNPAKILILLAIITAVLSAFMGSVTVALLIVPVTFSITDKLNVNPGGFLLTEIISSNIGGTCTPVGDPPNMLIGSATNLQFMDFVSNLTPIILVILAVTIVLILLLYRNKLKATDEDKKRVMELNEFDSIKDWLLLKRSLVVLALTIIGFFFQQTLHLQTATIALVGAVLLLLITKEEPEDVLLSVEWPTLFFFIGLFILVESLVKVGVINSIARQSLALTQGSLPLTTLLILWMSGIFSAFVDNIPFVTAMIPLIKDIGELTGMPLDPLWWSLALGTCLGGNGTLIGASANVVVAGISERQGYPITFKRFFVVGFPLMLVSLLLCTGYVYLRYLM
ncbi:MAG: ArsB/NhaD family transporter [Syntrophomonas sp.]